MVSFNWPYYILDFLTKRGNNTPPFNEPVIKFTVPTFKVNSSNTYECSKLVLVVVINNNLVVSKITSVVTVERFGKTSNDYEVFYCLSAYNN